jgi:preprotein translocase subunit SecE
MSKEKSAVANPLFTELFQSGVYKRNQGKLVRQVTFFALVIAIALGCWRLSHTFSGESPVYSLWLPLVLFGVGTWLVFRAVNIPRFADFLIAVEAEMNKVSWPSRGELFRSSLVVIFVIFGLAAILLAYDIFWKAVLKFLGIVGSGGGG